MHHVLNRFAGMVPEQSFGRRCLKKDSCNELVYHRSICEAYGEGQSPIIVHNVMAEYKDDK